jgi:hypothetical protein
VVPELEDINHPYLIEAKLMKRNAVIKRALETENLAIKSGVEDWFHFERLNGNAKIITITVPEYWAHAIVEFILNDILEREEKRGGR